MDPLTIFPPEVNEIIFHFVNPAPEELVDLKLVSREWKEFLETSPLVWKNLCRNHCHQPAVAKVRAQETSWKDTYRQTIGLSKAREMWIYRMPKVQTDDDLPTGKLSPLDAETWGDILETLINCTRVSLPVRD